MKLKVGETEYDYQRALQKIGLSHLYDLKVQGGIGKRSVAEALDVLDEGLRAEEGETPEQAAERATAVQEDERVLLGLAGLVFICKRFAGESVTWDEVGGTSLDDLRFVPDEADVQPADPTSPPVEVPEPGLSDGQSSSGTKPAGNASPKRSRTSKPTSTAA